MTRSLPPRFAYAILALVCALTISAPGPARADASQRAYAAAAAAPVAPTAGGEDGVPVGLRHKPHTIGYDRYSVTIDGQRVFLWSGEFHYFRLPSPELWRDVLQKLKAAGFNAVSIYFHWGYHSPKPGVYDFTGVRDVEKLLDIAEQTGLYVIARPGPYINAETDSGGFPAWLNTQAGHARTSAPDYLAAALEWMSRINQILVRHQVSDGTGPVLLYQIENEYSTENLDAVYMQALVDQVRKDGIRVPLFHNDQMPKGTWAPGKPGAPDLYSFDSYPVGLSCLDPPKWNSVRDYRQYHQFSPNTPLAIAELQSGSYDRWGGVGSDKCREHTDVDYGRVFIKDAVASGVSVLNLYMTYGGTNWGWLGEPSASYTSYDYGAAITEPRQLTAKYQEHKRIGLLTQSVPALAQIDPAPDAAAANPEVLIRSASNPQTGTRFLFLRHKDGTATSDVSTTFPLQTADGEYPVVPQAGAVRLNGRDGKLLVAGHDLKAGRLVYSTSELMTEVGGSRDNTVLLHGRAGEGGETVLRYASRPQVRVLAGGADVTWDEARKDLRINYTHQGLIRIQVKSAERQLTLLIADEATSATFWRPDTAAGPVLVRGPQLVRTAGLRHHLLELTGDTAAAADLEVWAPAGALWMTWNGRPVWGTRTPSGSVSARLRGPRPATLPAITGWRHQFETPERLPSFDDSTWTPADRTTTNNPTPPPAGQPVLYADEYGYHHGDVWYRGHFTATGDQTSLTLSATTGREGVYAAWLNGTYLGSSGSGDKTFAIPAGVLEAGKPAVLAVLVENMGHNQNFRNQELHKQPRGLTSGTLDGTPTAISWKIQGNKGGQEIADQVRGPFNNGGLFGERAGWSLPNYPDRQWAPVTLPATEPQPGVSWYRTEFSLHLPAGQDTSVGIKIEDDVSRIYRAHLFVNGWNIGNYLNNVGPQRVFTVPAGILRPDGRNTLAIASWGGDNGSGGLGKVSLVDLGTVAGGVHVRPVASPGWQPGR